SNATPTDQIYTLSLHDALPIWIIDATKIRAQSEHRINARPVGGRGHHRVFIVGVESRRLEIVLHVDMRLRESRWREQRLTGELADRKSTRLNSSHVKISYAVFC